MTQDSPGHVTRFDQSKEMELNPIEWGTQAKDPRNLSSRPRESALSEAERPRRSIMQLDELKESLFTRVKIDCLYC